MRRLLLIACAAALPGCANIDPYDREGVWRPSGANEANLRASVARPSELVTGTGERGSDGHLATQAVERLRTDRVRPLPAETASGVFALPSGGGGGGGPAAAGR
jgi:type IV pilus biogenesis protein CpaD/CtpE